MKLNKFYFVEFIDLVNEKAGQFASYLFFPGCIVVLYGVTKRYLFNDPVVWADDVSKFIFAIYFVVGGPYCLLHNSHIRVDVIYNRLSLNAKKFVEVFVVYPLFLAFIFPFIWHGSIFAWNSLRTMETSPPPNNIVVFPIKFVVPITGVLFLLQALVELYRFFSNSNIEGSDKDAS